ncbi:hybrid sensor histidine kinase/response regulator [Aeromonas hydrophila]|uniref:hybrid sensor histidine kinase/response regulator n=1 Tax=Aeromonas hydrophila TaxID=644 RepID=UPI0004D75CB1|nr:hybrid sensor histidine kinase/response regulator [Aeromonas hydrophila]EJN6953806.1 hybrid sensor histidine kinase/response regulator [Aeromonas hydrophila]KER61951.1 two-component hybrid sensor and regulator [Aeromonas hydrophila]MCX4039008.1 hybrid sensor histidine kinase/response regulator [Aeromonas hydrophila]OCA60627.1 two-component hybrid sensor and regulator [Aeromonas hydrophila]OCY10051.1 two-component hybrid sensor and regulator [Aeromonas hydrophila]
MSEILIVDDMASNRYILRSLLEEAGYRVREATDGLQAVDAATEFPPDLVLMDINMPVMDGYEACRRIKQLPGQWCLPVLFISTNSGIGALEQAFQAGGCDYVSKPFHQLEVLARVQNQLRLKELGRQQAKVQLYQSLFQLTAGIAHEINTPIGIGITASSLIHGAGDLLASAVQNGMLGQRLLQQQLTDIKEGTELVESSLRRVALLVTRFKELTRDQTELPATPFAVQKSLRKLLQAFTPEFLIARVNADLGGEEVTLTAPESLFLDLVQELIKNSMEHAFKGPGEHRLSLQVERAGSELLLIYRDNGPGMAAEQLAHLFEPFFTTLRGDTRHCGLSACRIHNLVENNLHGQLAVTSPPGEGLCYRIRLPLQPPL